MFAFLLLLLVFVEVVLVSFFLLVAPLTIFFLLLILVFIIAFLLEVLKGIQGTLLLLTAEFLSTSLLLNTEFKCLKSRPVSERRLCTNGFKIRYMHHGFVSAAAVQLGCEVDQGCILSL